MTAPAAELPALDALDDAQLRDVIHRAEELLKQRTEGKRQEALDRARAILSEAGLSMQDLVGNAGGATRGRPAGAGKGAKKASTGGKAGARYANPADPSQVYESGRGRAPKWYGELRAKGELPEPLPSDA